MEFIGKESELVINLFDFEIFMFVFLWTKERLLLFLKLYFEIFEFFLSESVHIYPKFGKRKWVLDVVFGYKLIGNEHFFWIIDFLFSIASIGNNIERRWYACCSFDDIGMWPPS